MADSLDPVRKKLWLLFEEEQELRNLAAQLQRQINEADVDDPRLAGWERRRDGARADLAEHRQRIDAHLRDAILDSPLHGFDAAGLDAFRDTAAREDLVFIMTKFPDEGNPLAPALARVIEEVQVAVRACGREPRIATWPYEDLVWRNVVLHMVGCGTGIAIVEGKYRPELNPNVAMEWGYMVGSGRKVRFLKEESFDPKLLRADFVGRTYEEFVWDDPKPGIAAAITKWFR